VCFATNTLKTGYYYFGDDQLCDYSGPDTSNLIGNYVYANGERVARFKGAAADVRYYLTDHLGSVVATVQRGGYLCNSNAYMPWGRVHASRVLDEEKFNYTGKERDGELGMGFLYYGARYYDPKLRTFLAVDPLASKYPSWSPYAYAKDNPVKYVDPNGEFVWLAPLGAALYYLLADYEYVQAPTREGDYVTPTKGESFLQHTGAVLGAAGAATLIKSLAGLTEKAAVADATATKAMSPMQRGLENEAKVLDDLGLPKNTKAVTARDPLTGIEGRTIPDAIDPKTGNLVEIKDRQVVSNTTQLRRQQQAAKDRGVGHEVYTGKRTHVTGPVQKSDTRIIPIDDLGPQE
jgi:RHS repeat-associated protein